MTENLKNHIAKFVEFEDFEYIKILKCFSFVKVVKKENLLINSNICKSNYFVSKGCLRLFFINEKGVEQTIQFAIENWWLSDYQSFSSKTISDFNIQAVEDSEIAVLNYPQQEDLLRTFPKMERYFRLIHERAHAAYQFRIKILYSNSREELYHSFITNYPAFVQRIPQYLLASFLGFTPEYLSEIRRKIIS